MSKLLKYFITLFICVAFAPSLYAAPSVDAWLSRTQIVEGESVQLTLESRDSGVGNPDTRPLQKDFEVLGTSSGSSISIVNGKKDSRVTWSISLIPKRVGDLVVPSLKMGGSVSPQLQLKVTKAPVASVEAGSKMFIETELSTKRPYIQGQVIYTVRLLYATNLSKGNFTAPVLENALVKKLDDDNEYATTRNAQRYRVFERRYAIFPQASGVQKIEAPIFNGEMLELSRTRGRTFRDLFGNDPFSAQSTTRRIRVHGEFNELTVLPIPKTEQQGNWLPAKKMIVKGQWQPAGGEVQQGQPITLTVDLQALGLTAGQLPNVAPTSVAGFKVYPDTASRDTQQTSSDIIGSLTQKIAFIPQQGGELSLPDLQIPWWNTETDQAELATIEGQSFSVKAKSIVQKQMPVVSQVKSIEPVYEVQTINKVDQKVTDQRWMWLSLALLTAWLITLLLLWRARQAKVVVADAIKKPETQINARKARKQFHAACKANDANMARKHLLEWSAIHWSEKPPKGLQALAERLQGEAVDLLLELDKALYRNKAEWKGASLYDALKELPRKQTKKESGGLAELY